VRGRPLVSRPGLGRRKAQGMVDCPRCNLRVDEPGQGICCTDTACRAHMCMETQRQDVLYCALLLLLLLLFVQSD